METHVLAMIIGGAGLAALGAAILHGARALGRELDALPRLTCEELPGPPGPVLVVGRARCDEPLVAPLSGAACVYVEITAWSKTRRGALAPRGSGQTGSSRQWALWRLEDATGSVPVDAQGAEALGTQGQTRWYGVTGPDREAEQFLKSLGVEPSAFSASSLSEQILPVGIEVAVRGELRPDGWLAGGSRMLVSSGTGEDLFRRQDPSIAGWAAVVVGAAIFALGVASVVLQEPSGPPPGAGAAPAKWKPVTRPAEE